MATKHTHFDSTEFNTLRNSAIPAAIMASPNTRFDSAEEASVFFARELDHVKAKTYDVEYPELTALSNFPISSEADAGDNTITYYTYDKTGLAKIISNYATDLPRADVKGKPTTAIIKSLGDSYGYSIQEMRASRMAGKSLDTRKAESARYQIDYLNNKIAWNGDAETGLKGVLSTDNDVPLYTVANGAKGTTSWADKTEDEILRALAVSNLIAIHQKKYIGPLSAYCGAVSAAAGAAAGIAFLHTNDISIISDSITNTLASVGGIVCDGAKASCAAKISSALEAAILGFELADEEKKTFVSGDGLVKENIEKTIETFGKVGKEGMKETDIEILRLMLEK